MLKHFLTLAILLICGGTVSSAGAADFYAGSAIDVASGNACTQESQCTLREAVALAQSTGGANRVLLTVAAVQLTSAISTFGSDLTIEGTLAPAPKVYGAPGSRVFAMGDINFTVRNLDIESGAGGISIERLGAPTSLTLEEVVLKNNIAISSAIYKDGGAIYSSAADLLIRRSLIDSNAAILGGGIYASGGSVSIQDSTVHGNTATGSYGGIAILNSAPTIERTTIDGNMAQNGAGGLALSLTNYPLKIVNSTIANNAVTSNSQPGVGGIQISYNNFNLGKARIDNITLSGNTYSGSASALEKGTSDVPIYNSIIQGGCSQGDVIQGTGNIESPGNTCSLNGNSNQISVTGMHLALGTLANNGGPTKTLLLGVGSYAIDAGTNCSDIDQRDLVRNVGACDVGALEVGATLPDSIFVAAFEP